MRINDRIIEADEEESPIGGGPRINPTITEEEEAADEQDSEVDKGEKSSIDEGREYRKLLFDKMMENEERIQVYDEGEAIAIYWLSDESGEILK